MSTSNVGDTIKRVVETGAIALGVIFLLWILVIMVMLTGWVGAVVLGGAFLGITALKLGWLWFIR